MNEASSAALNLTSTTPSGGIVDPTSRLGERALVIGGAGSTGNAWVIGVIAGLFDAGLDVTGADLVIGTSAGSTAAVQTLSAPPSRSFADTLAPVPPRRSSPVESDRGHLPSGPAAEIMKKTSEIIAAAKDAADMRRRMGAAALEAGPESRTSVQAQRRATVAARLPVGHWPARPLLIPAVDAHTGEPVVFDRHSGVDLVDAVAASTSNGFPYAIGDSHFINGGYRRNENADLATGYAKVLILSPFSGRSRHPIDWNMHLAAQINELSTQGSTVETIFPHPDSEHLFGASAMDLSLRPPAAHAGYDLGVTHAHHLADFWR